MTIIQTRWFRALTILLAGDRAQALRHFLAARSTYLRKLPVDREIQKILPAYRPDTFPPSNQ